MRSTLRNIDKSNIKNMAKSLDTLADDIQNYVLYHMRETPSYEILKANIGVNELWYAKERLVSGIDAYNKLLYFSAINVHRGVMKQFLTKEAKQ